MTKQSCQPRKCAIITPVKIKQELLYRRCRWSVKQAFKTHPGIFDELLFVKVQALNKGVSVAGQQGAEWVFFLAADEMMAPHAFEVANKFFHTYDAVWGQIFTIDKKPGNELAVKKLAGQLEWTDDANDILTTAPGLSLNPNGSGYFIKTEIALQNQNGGEDDFQYLLRLWHEHQCIKVPAPLCYIPSHNVTPPNALTKFTAKPPVNPKRQQSERSAPRMDLCIYSTPRGGSTLLADLLTVKGKSIILYEPDMLCKLNPYGFNEQDEIKKLLNQLHNYGIDVANLPDWNRVKYPTFAKYFHAHIYPRIAHLMWGGKFVLFDNWRFVLDTYRPRKLLVSVRDIRDVVLSTFDLALRLNRLITDEYWVQMRVLESCQQLVEMAKLPDCRVMRYEDLCSDPNMRNQIATYTGLTEIGDQTNFDAVVPWRHFEVEKHGKGISGKSIYRHRREPDGPALEMAREVWRRCPEYSEAFGYEMPDKTAAVFSLPSLGNVDNSAGHPPCADEPARPTSQLFWLGRSKRAARQAVLPLIPPGSIVLDLNSGTRSLGALLSDAGSSGGATPQHTHLPCDNVSRAKNGFICDPDKGVWPEANGATIIVALGMLEFISDVPGFLAQLRRYGIPVILSYHQAGNAADEARILLGWRNHLYWDELFEAITKAGFTVTDYQRIDKHQILLSIIPNDSKGDNQNLGLHNQEQVIQLLPDDDIAVYRLRSSTAKKS